MTAAPPLLDPGNPAFQDFLRRGGPSLLASDYDGTIAPFRTRRDEALPPASTRKLLKEILDSGGDIVILSGRRAGEVRTLLGLPVEIRGCHGWEILTSQGRDVSSPPPQGAKAAMASMRKALAFLPRESLEMKPVSIAVHWRGNKKSETAFSARSGDVERIAAAHGLEALPFNGGMEYRFPFFSKGSALKEILASGKKYGPVCFLGDDATDEDAFSAIIGKGLGILVSDAPRPSKASWRLQPSSMNFFLSLWLGILRGGDTN